MNRAAKTSRAEGAKPPDDILTLRIDAEGLSGADMKKAMNAFVGLVEEATKGVLGKDDVADAWTFSFREGSQVMVSSPNKDHLSAREANGIAKRIAKGVRALAEGTDKSLVLDRGYGDNQGNKTLKYLGDLCALAVRKKNPLPLIIGATGAEPVSLSDQTRHHAKASREEWEMPPYADYGSVTGILCQVSHLDGKFEVHIQHEFTGERVRCQLDSKWMDWALEHFGQRVEARALIHYTPQGNRIKADVSDMELPPEPLPWSEVPKLFGIVKV